MNEWMYTAAEKWIKTVEEQQQEIEDLKKRLETYDTFRLTKIERIFQILLQLGHDYHSFLELFEDEETKERAVQVKNILTRIEKDGIPTRSEAAAQPKSTQTERPFELLTPNDKGDS